MSDGRRNIMLGTAGHVDHGKTALVKLLTGCETDRLDAEKQRGLTIELGFAPCRMADERICGIVDVPGHVDFIRNMVAGAHGVDVVIFVIAADDGVMPQTREHLDILTLMGCRHGLVALTKSDLVDDEMLELAVDDVREYLVGTFLHGAAICPVSSVTGSGFDRFFTELNKAVGACDTREVTGRFRLWIERTFRVRGFGAVVSGIPTSGEVRVGDRLRLLPGGETVRVRGLQVYGKDADLGQAGECVAVNLSDVDAELLDRGKVLADPAAFESASMVEADLHLLASCAAPLEDYAEVHVHVGTGETMSNVAILDERFVEPGKSRLAQLRMKAALPVAPGDRFVIRGSMAGMARGRLTTLGGGRILDTSDIRLRRNRPWTLERLTARRDALDSPVEWFGVHLAEAECSLRTDELALRAQRSQEAATSAVEQLKADAILVEAPGGAVVHRDVVTAAEARIREAMEAFHDGNPARAGTDEQELFSQIDMDSAVLRLAMEGLLRRGELQRQGAVLCLAGHGPKLSNAEIELCERIEQRLKDAGLEPPLPEDLAAAVDTSPGHLGEMVQLLSDQGTLVPLDRKVVMHRDAVERARRVVLSLFDKGGGFETVQFRDALGVSRKYAVPLLDYFDTVRLTVRSGSRRTPGRSARGESA